MAIIKKSQVTTHEYYKTALPEDCECATCGKPLWRLLTGDETAIHWAFAGLPQGYDLFLHDECAAKLGANLIADGRDSRDFNANKLHYTIDRLTRLNKGKK